MTEYVILKATNEPGTIFSIAGEQAASSPERAIRLWGDTSADTAIFAAVPKRSWVVVRVDREVRETSKVTRL